MGSKTLLLIIIFCFFTACIVFPNYEEPDSERLLRLFFPVSVTVEMSCNCNGRVVIENFNVTMKNFSDIINERTTCSPDEHTRVCQLLEECEVCTAMTVKCKLSKLLKHEYQWSCQKSSYNMETSRSKIVKKKSSTADEPHVLLRKRRQAGVCFHPEKLENSVLKIVLRYKYKRLIQKCKYGYTMSDGISRDMRCNYDENRWYPTGVKFEACRPFIDCRVGLKHSGRTNCTTGTTDKAPMCQVSCPHYEDKPATEGTFVCHIDGKWKPELPHCAYAIHGVELVPAPAIKLHKPEQEAVLPETIKSIKKKRQHKALI